MEEKECKFRPSNPPQSGRVERTKVKINMNGYSFDGPFEFGVHELPAEAGVCLVCTESGYGIKVMSIEDTANIRDCIKKNKRRACWERVAEKKVIDIYFALIAGKEDRAKAASAVRNGRRYKIECEENN